jgi:hypothetical protein
MSPPTRVKCGGCDRERDGWTCWQLRISRPWEVEVPAYACSWRCLQRLLRELAAKHGVLGVESDT